MHESAFGYIPSHMGLYYITPILFVGVKSILQKSLNIAGHLRNSQTQCAIKMPLSHTISSFISKPPPLPKVRHCDIIQFFNLFTTSSLPVRSLHTIRDPAHMISPT